MKNRRQFVLLLVLALGLGLLMVSVAFAGGSEQNGAASLSKSAISAAPSGRVGAPAQGSISVTHSISQGVVSGNSVACSGGGIHTDNSYLRYFTLTDFGIVRPFDVTDVEFGVEIAEGSGGAQPATVNLYSWDPATPFLWANFSLLNTTTFTIPDMSLAKMMVPVTATVAPSGTLVVELFTPDGQGVNRFWVGSNAAGQTGLTYLAAADCGLTEPLDTGSIGFPNMHMVMNVYGDLAAPTAVSLSSFGADAGTLSPLYLAATLVLAVGLGLLLRRKLRTA